LTLAKIFLLDYIYFQYIINVSIGNRIGQKEGREDRRWDTVGAGPC
jgi:hypothetical protein